MDQVKYLPLPSSLAVALALWSAERRRPLQFWLSYLDIWEREWERSGKKKDVGLLNQVWGIRKSPTERRPKLSHFTLCQIANYA